MLLPDTMLCTQQEFFGGISIFTREQFERVNGYGVNFWGWGREDDNMRFRLMQHGMFPPEVPDVPKKSKRFYFEHQRHRKALEVLPFVVHFPPETHRLSQYGCDTPSDQPCWLADTKSSFFFFLQLTSLAGIFYQYPFTHYTQTHKAGMILTLL